VLFCLLELDLAMASVIPHTGLDSFMLCQKWSCRYVKISDQTGKYLISVSFVDLIFS